MKEGISDPLDRQELLRSVDALAKQHAARAQLTASELSRADAAAETFARVGLTPPLRRPVPGAQLVTAAPDGTLSLVPPPSHSPPFFPPPCRT